MTVQKPTNAIASEIARLRSINGDIDVQIEALESAKEQNSEAIAELEPHATWEDIEEPIIEPPTITDTPTG